MSTTQDVFDHHVQGFLARDIDMVLEDYTDNSMIIVNGVKYEGLAGARDFFSELFAELPADCAFEVTSAVPLGEFVYITWNAESDAVAYEFATDTFHIVDGKISLQTLGVVKRAKG